MFPSGFLLGFVGGISLRFVSTGRCNKSIFCTLILVTEFFFSKREDCSVALSRLQIHCNLFLQEAELDFQNLKVGWIKDMIFICKDFFVVIGVIPACVNG